MNSYRSIFLVLASFGLWSCGGSDNVASDVVVTKSFDDFKMEVIEATPSLSVDCGTVEIGESELDVNLCIAGAFANGQAFYAFYELQGFDSGVGEAISSDELKVYHWSYDSNPSGGIPASNSLITQTECNNPEFSGSVDGGHSEVFTCN